jgi:hypothetical protein
MCTEELPFNFLTSHCLVWTDKNGPIQTLPTPGQPSEGDDDKQCDRYSEYTKTFMFWRFQMLMHVNFMIKCLVTQCLAADPACASLLVLTQCPSLSFTVIIS